MRLHEYEERASTFFLTLPLAPSALVVCPHCPACGGALLRAPDTVHCLLGSAPQRSMQSVSFAAAAIPSPALVSRALYVVGSPRVAHTLLRPPPCFSPQRSRRTPLPATPPLPTMKQDVSAFGATPSMRVQLLDPRAVAPARGSATAAGYDLSALEDGSVPARGRALLRTGLAIALPTDVYGRVAPRSGLAWKKGLDVGAGVIDADYRGEVRVLLFNLSDEDIHGTLLDCVDCPLHLLCSRMSLCCAPRTGGGFATCVCWLGALAVLRECVSSPLMSPSRCVGMRPFLCVVRLMDPLHSQGWRPHCAAHSGAHLYPGGGGGRVARGDRAGCRWFWFHGCGSACSYPGVRRPSPYGLRVPLYKSPDWSDVLLLLCEAMPAPERSTNRDSRNNEGAEVLSQQTQNVLRAQEYWSVQEGTNQHMHTAAHGRAWENQNNTRHT